MTLRSEAEAFLRSQPTELVWVPCTLCGIDTLVKHKTWVIQQAQQRRVVLGGVCDDCRDELKTPA